MMTPMSATPRPVALVTAPFRGEGLETLRDLADVVLDPWITADTRTMDQSGRVLYQFSGSVDLTMDATAPPRTR